MDKVVVSFSGGLDSTILLYKMVRDYGVENVYALSFFYNQRHNIELLQAKRTTKTLKVSHTIIDISFLGAMVAGVSSMVIGNIETPGFSEKDMPSSYVPFRNGILTMISASFAESIGANIIALGLNMDQPDEEIIKYRYWDITPKFFEAMSAVLKLNTTHPLQFIAPFLLLSKVEEIQLGQELKVPYKDTFTCYNPLIEEYGTTYEPESAGGYNRHITHRYTPCGVCPSCFERAESFRKVGLTDPILEGVIA